MTYTVRDSAISQRLMIIPVIIFVFQVKQFVLVAARSLSLNQLKPIAFVVVTAKGFGDAGIAETFTAVKSTGLMAIPYVSGVMRMKLKVVTIAVLQGK